MIPIALHTTRHFTMVAKFLATSLGFALLLTACQQTEQKVADAKDRVAAATQDLKEVRRDAVTEWQEAWLNFKRDNDQDITANERRILELRKEVNDVETRYRAQYGARIDEVERRNNELRDRVNNCVNEGMDRWVEFRKDVTRDMDDLKSSIKNITIKKS